MDGFDCRLADTKRHQKNVMVDCSDDSAMRRDRGTLPRLVEEIRATTGYDR